MTRIVEHAWGNAPAIERLRLPVVKRSLTVKDKFYITPNMIRIVLAGEELAGFQSPSPDDNIKIFTPDADGMVTMRSYTPRAYDAATNELVLDFAVHEAGPATRWALGAQIGDDALIGGPRGSKVVRGGIRKWLLIGDETALPAMLRRVEDAEAGVSVTLLASVPTADDAQDVQTRADYNPIWLARDGISPKNADFLIDHLRALDVPTDTFVWLAAEGAVTKAVRHYLMSERGVPAKWIKATGYWVAGKADTTAKFED